MQAGSIEPGNSTYLARSVPESMSPCANQPLLYITDAFLLLVLLRFHRAALLPACASCMQLSETPALPHLAYFSSGSPGWRQSGRCRVRGRGRPRCLGWGNEVQTWLKLD